MSETPKTKLVSSGKSANASKKVAVSDGTPKAAPAKKAPAKKTVAAKKAIPAPEVTVEATPKGFWARIKAIFLGA